MTADAVTAALAHSTRPVRLVGATTGRNRADRPAGPQHRTAPGVDGLVPDRRGCAAAAAPTHPTLRRRSPPQHGRGRNLALVPPAAARDWHPPAAAPTERFRNLEPDPRAAGRAAGECARHPGTTDVAELGGRSVRPAAEALPARCPSGRRRPVADARRVALTPPPSGAGWPVRASCAAAVGVVTLSRSGRRGGPAARVAPGHRRPGRPRRRRRARRVGASGRSRRTGDRSPSRSPPGPGRPRGHTRSRPGPPRRRRCGTSGCGWPVGAPRSPRPGGTGRWRR